MNFLTFSLQKNAKNRHHMEMAMWRCSVKKMFLKLCKIHGKAYVQEPLSKQSCRAWNTMKRLQQMCY